MKPEYVTDLSAPLNEALVALRQFPAEHVHEVGVLGQETPLRTAPPSLEEIIAGLPGLNEFTPFLSTAQYTIPSWTSYLRKHS